MCQRCVIVAGFAWLSLVSQLPAENKLQPFSVDWTETDRSIVDLSRFLQAPAGRAGFLRVENGHLALPDGTRFRAWGVNAPFEVCFIAKDLAPRMADDFARLGFNCVRFHHLDVPWGANIFDPRYNDTQHLNAEMIDRLDFFIAELKKRGIYFTLTFNVHREFKPGDGVTDYEQLGMGKPAYYFDARIQELYLQFVRQLLTHRNPYTGNEYRHEPALAWMELLNENSLIEAWAQWRLMVPQQPHTPHTWSPIPASYGAQLTQQWAAWQESHVPADTRRLWATTFGSKPDEAIPRSQPHDWPDNCVGEHYLAELEFYMHLEHELFARAQRLIRDELSAQPLLIGDGDHNDTISPYPHALSFNLQGNFLDGHGYWQHPDLGPPLRVNNTPMVNDPLDSTVVQFARTPVEGRPFTISETNHPFPHQYACEGLPIADSSRLLLVTTAKVENSGMAWQAAGTTIADWGRLPMTIEPVTGTITFAGLTSARQITVRPLSAVGVPQDSAVTALQVGADWSFSIGGPPATTWYLLEISRDAEDHSASVNESG